MEGVRKSKKKVRVGLLAAIGPVARSNVVNAIAERLQSEILTGSIAAGARLPSERELALALGVNRLTLRAALGRLEALGLITTRHGSGSIVMPWRETAGLATISPLLSSLSPSTPAWKEMVSALLELRRVLMAEAIALAAERRKPEELRILRKIAIEQAERLPNAVAFARGDVDFQRAIVRMARSVGLELVLNTFAKFPDEQPELVTRLYENRTTDLYDVVIALIESGDGASARDAVRYALAGHDEQFIVAQGIAGPPSRPLPKEKKRKS